MTWTPELAKSELTYAYLEDLLKRFPAQEILKDGKSTGNYRTSIGRLIYYDLFKPGKMEDSESEAKFSATIAFLPDDECKALKIGAGAKAKEFFGDKIPANMRKPFRQQSEKDKPGFLAEGVYINATSKADRKPELIDRKNGQPITNESDLYRGCWVMATVRPYAYDQRGNKGVSFGLVNVIKIRDDLPLAAGSIRASDAYADLLGDTSSSSGEDDTNYDDLMG